jgi:hypothetical protein
MPPVDLPDHPRAAQLAQTVRQLRVQAAGDTPRRSTSTARSSAWENALTVSPAHPRAATSRIVRGAPHRSPATPFPPSPVKSEGRTASPHVARRERHPDASYTVTYPGVQQRCLIRASAPCPWKFGPHGLDTVRAAAQHENRLGLLGGNNERSRADEVEYDQPGLCFLSCRTQVWASDSGRLLKSEAFTTWPECAITLGADNAVESPESQRHSTTTPARVSHPERRGGGRNLGRYVGARGHYLGGPSHGCTLCARVAARVRRYNTG